MIQSYLVTFLLLPRAARLRIPLARGSQYNLLVGPPCQSWHISILCLICLQFISRLSILDETPAVKA